MRIIRLRIIYLDVWCITLTNLYVGSAKINTCLRTIAKRVNSSMYFCYCWNYLEKPASYASKFTYGKILWVLTICRRKFKLVQHMQARFQTDTIRNQWLVWLQPLVLVIFAHKKNANGLWNIRGSVLQQNWRGPEPMEFDIPHWCDIPGGHLHRLRN